MQRLVPLKLNLLATKHSLIKTFIKIYTLKFGFVI